MIVNGTTYNDKTPKKVVQVLEDARKIGTRLRLFYGDTETGRAWLEEHDVTGRIGRSTGQIKIPLLIHNRRSMGGPGLLDHCIVKIATASGGLLLYQHPSFSLPKLEKRYIGPESATHNWEVTADGSVQARFRTETQADRYIKFFTL